MQGNAATSALDAMAKRVSEIIAGAGPAETKDTGKHACKKGLESSEVLENSGKQAIKKGLKKTSTQGLKITGKHKVLKNSDEHTGKHKVLKNSGKHKVLKSKGKQVLKKPAGVPTKSKTAALPFPGVPKKAVLPLEYNNWRIYTDINMGTWRCKRIGERKDKTASYKVDAAEAWEKVCAIIRVP